MKDIISWYNRNRKKIIGISVTAIILIIIINRIINMNRENNPNYRMVEIAQNPINTEELNTVTITRQESTVSGEKITTSQEKINVIDKFIENCNSQKVLEAYNLLSEDCKQEMYPTVQEFEQTYYKTHFGGEQKTAKMENWIGDTYFVSIIEDVLATGKYDSNSTKQDYITIVEDSNNQPKLNIANYIGRKQINQTQATNGVQITLKHRDTYMDYEYYTFEIKNNTDKLIALGEKQDRKFTYLTDQNGLEHDAYLTEIDQTDLLISPKDTKTIKIKYFNTYSSTRTIKSLTIQSVILNYDDYGIDTISPIKANINFEL